MGPERSGAQGPAGEGGAPRAQVPRAASAEGERGAAAFVPRPARDEPIHYYRLNLVKRSSTQLASDRTVRTARPIDPREGVGTRFARGRSAGGFGRLGVPAQLSFEDIPKHGGLRPGAGRKPIERKRPPVPHRSRPTHARWKPVHVTLRASRYTPNLREQILARAVEEAIRATRPEGFRVVHFSTQSDHLHALVEADTHEAFVRGRGSRVSRRGPRGSACPPVVPPETKLLAVFWQKHGLVHPGERPAAVR